MVLKADFEILDDNILLTKWFRGKIVLDEVIDIMEQMLVLIEQNNIVHYIDDISECEVDWEEADKWIINDWYPRALRFGVKKNALIVREGINMRHKDDQCEIRSFNCISKALKWLKNADKRQIKNFQYREIMFFITLLSASILRSFLWVYFFDWNSLNILVDFFYTFILYFNVVGGFMLLNKSKIGDESFSSFFYSHYLYWGILFVLIPVISNLVGSGYKFNVPFFKYIPTFTIENNYLPAGMLYVIPPIIYLFLLRVKEFLKINLIRAFLSLTFILTLNYLILYQWLFHLCHEIAIYHGYASSISVYGIVMLIIMLPFFMFLNKRLNLSKKWSFLFYWLFYTFVFLGFSHYLYYYYFLQS